MKDIKQNKIQKTIQQITIHSDLNVPNFNTKIFGFMSAFALLASVCVYVASMISISVLAIQEKSLITQTQDLKTVRDFAITADTTSGKNFADLKLDTTRVSHIYLYNENKQANFSQK